MSKRIEQGEQDRSGKGFSGGRGPRRILTVASLLFGLASVAEPAVAQVSRIQGNNLALSCTQPSPTGLICNFRQPRPAKVLEVSAYVGTTALPAPGREAFPGPEETSAVLFLVDTSDPARQATITRTIEHITALTRAAKSYHRLGLASFDSELRVAAPLGSPAERVIEAARRLVAVGQTTELYRSALRAVERLGAYPATRRTLLLFSDGLAEDTAYFHRDVVEAARRYGVTIYGLGYPRSVAESVALQTLRRLGEETGGLFVTANEAHALPPAFLADPYVVADNGGRLTFDLTAAAGTGATGEAAVRIVVTTADGESSASVPVELPAPAPKPAPPEPRAAAAPPAAVAGRSGPTPVPGPSEPAAPATPPSAPPRATTGEARETPPPARPSAPPRRPVRTPFPPAENGVTDGVLYGGFTVGILVLLALLTLAARLMRRRRQSREAGDDQPPEEEKIQTLGFLEIQDGTGARHAIESAAYRIGRSSANELTLDDPSISRHHAEIHRRRDGTFTVTDLDSLNGVFVNDRKVKTCALANGDVVEVGDVMMHFVTASPADLVGAETVIMSTDAPGLDLSDKGAA